MQRPSSNLGPECAGDRVLVEPRPSQPLPLRGNQPQGYRLPVHRPRHQASPAQIRRGICSLHSGIFVGVYFEFRSLKSPTSFAGQKFLERDRRRWTTEQHEPGALPPAHGALRPQHDALRAARRHRLPGLPRSAAGQVGRVVLRARRTALLVRHGDAGGLAQEVEERQGQDASEVAPSGTREIGKILATQFWLA